MRKPLTHAEARYLAKEGRRRYGTYRISGTEQQYPCPLAVAVEPRTAAHRITVVHKPWEKITARMVDQAVIEHLCSDDPDEQCPNLPDGEEAGRG
jgi:adenylyl- and sulfurtransferase ThiI